jgi:hypothetical protein
MEKVFEGKIIRFFIKVILYKEIKVDMEYLELQREPMKVPSIETIFMV